MISFDSTRPPRGRVTLRTGFVLAAYLTLAPATTAQEHALPLWVVEHEAAPLYLLGSVHMLRPEAYPLHDALYEAFDEAEVAVFEFHLGTVDEIVPEMLARGMMGDGRTLREVVPAETYTELGRRLEELGLPIEMVDGMKPWMASLILTTQVAAQSGFDASAGVDDHFHRRAVAAGLPVQGLETARDQLELFDGMPEDQQIALLEATLETFDDTVAYLDRLTAHWQRGDAEAVAGMMLESLVDHPGFEERLLFARNRAWIPQIESLIEEGRPAIVIVGMGHLVGPQSVVELLEARGYTVRQVVLEEVEG